MDGGLEPLRFGHLPLVQREPLHRPAMREVGLRLMVVLADDPYYTQHGRAVASQDNIALADSLDEVEDLDGRLADLLGDAGIPLTEEFDQLLL